MQFASPWMLFGLALCAIPVLIHLLSRREYRREPWAGMQFLRAAIRRRSEQIRLESLLLLVVRTLLLAMVVTAVAEPLFQSGGRPPGGREAVHRILVLDASASMSRSDGRSTAFERAERELQRLLDSAQAGDAFQLVRIATSSPSTIIRSPTFDRDEVRFELERMDVTPERGQVGGALQSTAELLQQVSDSAHTEVVIVSDFQRSNWLPANGAERARIQRLTRDLAKRAAVRFIDVGRRSAANSAVAALTASRPVLSPGEGTLVEARVRNFGAAEQPGRLDWIVNGRTVETTPFQLGGEAEATLPLIVEAPESPVCEIEVRLSSEDELTIDNRRYLSLPVRRSLNALLVEGRPALRPMQGASDFLRVALAPRSASVTNATRRMAIVPQTVTEAELSRVDLAAVDCIWLCDVPRIDPLQQRRLATFVEHGGGLVVSMGDQVDLAASREWRTAAGSPLLPGTLEEVRDLDDAEPPFVTWDFSDPPHPILRPFEGNPESGLTSALTRRYVAVRLPAEANVQVVARFSNGDPAIVEHRVGLGRVLLVLTSVDDRWGSWAVWPSFLPMVHEIVLHATYGTPEPRGLLAGARVEKWLPAASFDVDAALSSPGGRRREIPLQCDARGCRIQLEGLSEPGFYRLEFGPPLSETSGLAVNLDPEESDAARVTEAELAASAASRSQITYQTEWQQAMESPAGMSERGSLSGILLSAALVLLLAELLMAWKIRWGLGMLAVCGIGMAVTTAAGGNPIVAVALVVLLCAAGLLVGQRLIPRLRPAGSRFSPDADRPRREEKRTPRRR